MRSRVVKSVLYNCEVMHLRVILEQSFVVCAHCNGARPHLSLFDASDFQAASSSVRCSSVDSSSAPISSMRSRYAWGGGGAGE